MRTINEYVGISLLVLLLLMLSAFVLVVIDEAYHHWEQKHSISDPPKDTRPVIPKCDKELWDRVRGECE